MTVMHMIVSADRLSMNLHRDAYVLGQGFWLFSHVSGALGENFFSLKWSLLNMLQYSKIIFDVNIKLLPVHLLLNVQKRSKNANIPNGQIKFEREKWCWIIKIFLLILKNRFMTDNRQKNVSIPLSICLL